MADIASGCSQVWVIQSDTELFGVFTVAVHEADVRWAEIELLAGVRFDEWMDGALEQLEQWARGAGIQQIVFYGREGFERKLRARGFTARRIEGVKELH